MNLTEQYKDTGLKLSNGFPNIYHIFNHGGVIAHIEKNGGIDKFGFIDVRKEGDMIFPNRWYSFMLDNSTWYLERPMYGPAVKFISTAHDGTVFHHMPKDGRILPYGVISSQKDPDFGENSYHLFVERDRTLRLIIKVAPGTFSTFEALLCKYHISDGDYKIRQNQLLDSEYGTAMLSADKLYNSLLNREPFENIQGKLTWEKSYFDADNNALIYPAMRTFEDGKKIPLYMVFGCSEKIQADETVQNWMMKTIWKDKTEIAFSIALGEDLPALLKKVSVSAAEAEEKCRVLIESSAFREKNSPAISIPEIPAAADFARVVQDRQAAITIRDTGKYAAILAASGNFGYFICWDHNYPIRDFITTGDFDTAKQLLRYGLDYPHMKTLAFSVSQLILEVSELIAFEGNCDFLKEYWKKIQELFEFIKCYIDPETGMVRSCHCCGVDNPAEIGLSSTFYAACINAWHYAAARTMANFAMMLGEEEKAAKYYAESEKLKVNYPRYFFNGETGTLRVAVNDDYMLPSSEVYHNSSSIGLDYPYGEFLLRECVPGIAEYYRTKLRHPEGYSAIAYNSQSPCEMWRSVYMNQHIGHNTRVARLNNDVKEAKRVAKHYFQAFEDNATAVETFNIDGMNGDTSQWTKWQAFSATAALHCLHQSIAGIAWSRGGLAYLPADDQQKIELRNFRFDGKVWNISVEGSGRYVRCIRLNEKDFYGSMQVPSDLVCREVNTLEIFRSETPWEKPVLLYATDIPICNVEETESGIAFTVDANAVAPMKFFAPGNAVLSVNGMPVSAEYCSESKTLWIDMQFHKGDRIVCCNAENTK